jgi:hypothetical protein
LVSIVVAFEMSQKGIAHIYIDSCTDIKYYCAQFVQMDCTYCVHNRVGPLLKETNHHLVLFSLLLKQTKWHLVLALPN